MSTNSMDMDIEQYEILMSRALDLFKKAHELAKQGQTHDVIATLLRHDIQDNPPKCNDFERFVCCIAQVTGDESKQSTVEMGDETLIEVELIPELYVSLLEHPLECIRRLANANLGLIMAVMT